MAGFDISERMLEDAYASLASLSLQYEESVSKNKTDATNGSDVSRSWILAQSPLEDFDPALFIHSPFKPQSAGDVPSPSSGGIILPPVPSTPLPKAENGSVHVNEVKSDVTIPQHYNIVTAHLCLHYVSDLAALFKRVYRWTLPGTIQLARTPIACMPLNLTYRT